MYETTPETPSPLGPSPREEGISAEDLGDGWPILSNEERLEGFRLLDRDAAAEFLLTLSTLDQADLLRAMPANEARLYLRLLEPDDAADLLQAVPAEDRE